MSFVCVVLCSLYSSLHIVIDFGMYRFFLFFVFCMADFTTDERGIYTIPTTHGCMRLETKFYN